MTDDVTAPSKTLAWFHCFSGISGDMALGSLIDAGADLEEVKAIVSQVPLTDWDLRSEVALRGGLACSRVIVRSPRTVLVRTYSHIVGLISEARLPERVATRSLAAFRALAEVEGRLHRRPVEQVHFHEVGGHDTVVDIVGTAAALEVLGVDEVTASHVATGTGTVRSAHGVLPNPAPAVVQLLQGIPSYGRPSTVELTTPTGAALLAALATSFGPMPAMTVQVTGFGAGRAELADAPNCTQVVLGTAAETGNGGGGQPLTMLEANVDDATGEQLAHAIRALIDAGAYDAWTTPAVMKKGRPGHTLHALVDPAITAALREVMVRATGTFGVRGVQVERWASPRHGGEVDVEGHPVRVKAGPGRAKAEFEDVARTSARTGLTLHEVASRAEEAWRGRHRGPEGPPPDEPEPA